MKAGRRRYAPRVPREERRERVLDAALRIVVSRGYRGVSMEAIAREEGVAKPVAYNLFGDLGELLRALIEREERRALEQLEGAVPTLPLDRDPDDVLAESMGAYLAAVAAQPDTWRLLLLPTDGTPELVRAHVDRGRANLVGAVEQLVAWGIERRGGPRRLDTELFARVIVSLGESAARLVLADPERYSPERLTAFTRSLMSVIERDEPGPG